MSQSKAAAPEPTEIAGRYQVVQKLGAGAFGTVYKARDRVLDRMVAIKTMRLEGLAAAGADLDELIKRFEKEAKNSAKLKHPSIVTIYDFGNADGLSYIAMEFIDGAGLDRMIVQSGRLAVERAASLAAQVADALDFAHRNNVVHRDIKPANIMIEAGDRVKVTDFGIAKATDSGDHLTMTGSLLGTPSYMSPEQARGGDIDGRSDLFSLGCVLYEMLAGKKAFRGESITALIFKIITEEPPPIRELDPDLSDEMVRIVTRAISKAPETRYQSGREMADDLLALTRAGATPTLREVETPTASGSAISPTAAPTLKPSTSPPTLASPGTLSSAPTAAGLAAPPTRMIPAPPTRVTSPRPPAPSPAPPAPAPAPPVAPRPATARAARPETRKSGAGAGLLIGLGIVGVLSLGVVAVGVWFLFLRTPATTIVDAGPGPTLETPPIEPTAGPPPIEEPSALVTPPTAAAVPTTPATAPPATARSSGEAGRPAATAPPPTPRPATATPATDPAWAFLDNEEPVESVDGRAAGEALARGYRSDQGGRSGSGFGATARFRQRERNPRPQGPVELRALKTLRYIVDSQEVYHQKNSRYATFPELFAAQQLDVATSGNTFRRQGYRYSLEVAEDGFKVTAMPLEMGGPRAFTGDDSGKIRPGVE